MLPEERARIKIDKQLTDAGWDIVPRDEFVPQNAQAVKEALMQGNTESDYLLFVDGKAIAVVEAKKEENNLGADVAAQAESYSVNPQGWYQLWFPGQIPLVYLANGNKYYNAPIGERSDTVRLQCSILTLPRDVVNLYRAILQRVNIHSSSYYISPIANYAAIETQVKNKNVVIIDIGLRTTTCSVFVAGKLRSTFQVSSGSYQMSKAIERELDIDFEIADELKIKFGSCFNNIEFKSSIYRRNDGRYISDVSICKIIEREMDSILGAIKENIRDVLHQFTFTIVACGGGSHMINIDKKLSKFFNADSYHFVPDTLGIRHSSYTVISGLLEICKDRSYIDGLSKFTTRENKIADNLDKEIIVDKQINIMENSRKETNSFNSIFDPDDFK